MREIKFRGRDEHGKWHYGDLLSWPIIRSFNGLNKEVAADTVGQFTGLKDCEEREIYEGDIVRFKLPPMVLTNEKTAVGAVVYEYGQFLVIIHALRFTIFSVINDCTVIGNVHDNPELLEATEGGRP